MALAQRIADGLAARRLSLRSGAALVPCSPAHLMRISKGMVLPDYATLVKIADAIGVRRDELVAEWMAEQAGVDVAVLPASVASTWAHYATAYPVVLREIEVVGTIAENGDLFVSRHYRDARATRALVRHGFVRERTAGIDEPAAAPSHVSIEQSPAGMVIDIRSETLPPWRNHHLDFSPPWGPESGALSYSLHSKILSAYATTRESYAQRLEREPTKGTAEAPRASHAYLLHDCTERLTITVRSAHDEEWLEPEAWSGPGPILNDPLPLDKLCVSNKIAAAPRSYSLTIERPLPGHWYSVRWAASLQ